MSLQSKEERLGKMIIERSFRYSENPPFTLASGKTSPYYFNCKPTTLDPEGMNLIGEILFDMLKNTEITAAGGLTLGADPIANALSVISYQKGKPIKSFIVRKEAKDHGTKSAVEGNIVAGEKVAIIDDVITTGASTITAIQQAQKAGLDVRKVVALIDREEGGRENILQYVSDVEAVFTKTQIMAIRFRMQQETAPTLSG